VTRIVSIVEGHGEVAAVPILVRRIAQAVAPGIVPDVPQPIRVPRQRVLKDGELERAVELAARTAGPGGGILVLLDADEDCPKDLAVRLLGRARFARSDRSIHVVLAKTEYESWFLAAAGSLAGRRGLRGDVVAPPDPESIRDPKGWLGERMSAGRTYRETLDQPALTAEFDLEAARTSRSFEKLWRSVSECLRRDMP
jgi:hypothetical protein